MGQSRKRLVSRDEEIDDDFRCRLERALAELRIDQVDVDAFDPNDDVPDDAPNVDHSRGWRLLRAADGV